MGRLQAAAGQQGFPVTPGPLLCPHVSPKNARSHNLDKGGFVWQPWRGKGESGRRGCGQERVSPPLWLALPPLLALGRKHLCSLDTHILPQALDVLPDLRCTASPIFEPQFPHLEAVICQLCGWVWGSAPAAVWSSVKRKAVPRGKVPGQRHIAYPWEG